MDMPQPTSAHRAVDAMQSRLTEYALGLKYEALPREVVHAAKVRVIDTLGSLIGGFFGEPCRIARNVVARMPNPAGATIVGTRMKASPDMAAFVNGGTARYAELNDIYHWPHAFGGHPSDVLMPVLAVAEQTQATGAQFIAAVVLAYEIYLRFSDVFRNVELGFDHTNLACLGAALGCGKLYGLDSRALAHCLAIAAVPNVILRQVRSDHYSVWKAMASGQAGRAGVFAAMLAKAGMEGPHLPFEGRAGWCRVVARDRFELQGLGGRNGDEFKIVHTLIKHRASCGTTISSILAAEKAAPIADVDSVKQVIVEVYQKAKDRVGSGEHRWNPDCRETADHSIPYVVAATLIDGTVTPRSFDDAHLADARLRALMKKIEVVPNEEFTKAYVKLPVEHRTRVTVIMQNGERTSGESGADKDDLSTPKTDEQIVSKFRGLTEEYLGAKQVKSILDRLWTLEGAENVASIPPAFVLD